MNVHVVVSLDDVAKRGVHQTVHLVLPPRVRLELPEPLAHRVGLSLGGRDLRLARRVELELLRKKILDDGISRILHRSVVRGVNLVRLFIHLRVKHLHLVAEVLVLALEFFQSCLEHDFFGEEVLDLLRELFVFVAAVRGGWRSERRDVALDGDDGELAELGFRAVLLGHLALLHAEHTDEWGILRVRGTGTGSGSLSRLSQSLARKRRWCGGHGGRTCGRISSFITSQHRLNTSLLSSKSHRMFCLYLVCSSSALYGVLAVGTRSTWIWSLGMTNWYAVPKSPVAATKRARLASTSSVPSRLTPSPLDMT